MSSPTLVWFRRDLRLADNSALEAALRHGGPVICVYVLDETPSLRPMGGASRWWLDKSLKALAADLEARGSRLILRRGLAEAVIHDLVTETGAGLVTWNACFDPGHAERDGEIARALKGQGVAVRIFNGSYLLDPGKVVTKTGGTYGVFTPFWKAASLQVKAGHAQPAPAALPAPETWPGSETLADWGLHPTRPDWSGGMTGTPGEAGAQARLAAFVSEALSSYGAMRDIPSRPGTSGLSPHLHFGEISPRAVWRAAHASNAPEDQRAKFLSEIGWREFNLNILNTRGDVTRRNVNPAFDAFPWREDPAGLAAWQKGQTGYPIVDAGMRELWTTGIMHNRVRMIVASFLTKHLLIDWRAGEAWFWDTLTDADMASNGGNWQWVAGSGADAAPYFRIFNPIRQSETFDPEGIYIRRWVPELARLGPKDIHAPWAAPAMVRAEAGVKLGSTYPLPIIDHDMARKRALEAYQTIRKDKD